MLPQLQTSTAADTVLTRMEALRSSGHPDLDNEVMAMIVRAEPLPPFPATMTQDRVDLTVPIRFSLRWIKFFGAHLQVAAANQGLRRRIAMSERPRDRLPGRRRRTAPSGHFRPNGREPWPWKFLTRSSGSANLVAFPPLVLKLSIENACAGETATDEAANPAAAANNAIASRTEAASQRDERDLRPEARDAS